MYKLTNEEVIRRCKEKHGDKFIKCLVDKAKTHNGSYGRSSTEDILYSKLVDLFGIEYVIRQYKDSRYPFCCDFYITSLDLFIELNAFWSHGGHWYDSSSSLDLQKLRGWMAKDKVFYKCAANVWSKADVKKRQVAAKNHIRYVVFWDNNLSDFDSWVESGMPIRYDWK